MGFEQGKEALELSWKFSNKIDVVMVFGNRLRRLGLYIESRFSNYSLSSVESDFTFDLIHTYGNRSRKGNES